MKTCTRIFLLIDAAIAAAPLSAQAAEALPKPTLTSFRSDTELKAWLDALRRRLDAEPRRRASSGSATADFAVAAPAPAIAAQAPAAPMAKATAESVTNTQVAGVDEGGIVKVHGEHLVVLRRGRLFTVNIRGSALSPVAIADAFAPGIDPSGAWYDEMLIEDDTVVIIGYSYRRGGAEVGLFDIDRGGRLTHRATYHLRSNDYYSSRNYASRLVGNKLIFYTPLYLNLRGDPLASLPSMRRWRGEANAGEFRRIAPATRIYRTDDPVEPQGLTLHTVTVCDLGAREMDCAATGVLGPHGRVFHVAQESVYVWTTGQPRAASGQSAQAGIFRIPLDGGAPTALKASGSPVDQFSFLESGDGHLNVLVRARGRGEAMWAAEGSAGDTALLRVPLALFGDGRQQAPAASYRRLPNPRGHTLQNRFVGAYLLYGAGNTWGTPGDQRGNALHAVRWDQAGTAQTLALPHGVDRIEALGRHAVIVVAAGRDLHFSSVRLDEDASLPHRYTMENAVQGETRSHGFFYKPESELRGMIGLPIVGGGRPGHRQLREGSAAVLFLHNDGLLLGEIGKLDATRETQRDDNCRASCVDWYGNARPLFVRGRVFALLGYEIVEGRLGDGGISEVRRVNFGPV